MEFNFEMTPNESALLSCGKDFLNAAARCLGVNEHGVIEIINDGKFITLAAPATINAAFAFEMFLKALVMKSGKKYPTDRNGHNLRVLYNMLPEAIQKRLCQLCVDKSDEAKSKFLLFLDNHSKDFVDVRYYATREGWQGMSPIIVYTYAFNMCNVTQYLLSSWEKI